MKAVLLTKPVAAVAKAAAKCKAAAEAVQSALDDLSHPQAEYSSALAARDALLPSCEKALRKLKTHAKAAWDDEPGVYAAIFAPPDKVQSPVKPQARKQAKTIQTKMRRLPKGDSAPATEGAGSPAKP